MYIYIIIIIMLIIITIIIYIYIYIYTCIYLYISCIDMGCWWVWQSFLPFGNLSWLWNMPLCNLVIFSNFLSRGLGFSLATLQECYFCHCPLIRNLTKIGLWKAPRARGWPCVTARELVKPLLCIYMIIYAYIWMLYAYVIVCIYIYIYRCAWTVWEREGNTYTRIFI